MQDWSTHIQMQPIETHRGLSGNSHSNITSVSRYHLSFCTQYETSICFDTTETLHVYCKNITGSDDRRVQKQVQGGDSSSSLVEDAGSKKKRKERKLLPINKQCHGSFRITAQTNYKNSFTLMTTLEYKDNKYLTEQAAVSTQASCSQSLHRILPLEFWYSTRQRGQVTLLRRNLYF